MSYSFVMDFSFLEFILCELLRPPWMTRILLVMLNILWGNFLIEFYGYLTGSATRQETQIEPPTPDDDNKVLPENKIERSLTQNETRAPNCPAEKPDGISPTVQMQFAFEQLRNLADLRKAYKADLRRTNRSLTEVKFALKDSEWTRKEQERQLEVQKSKLRLAEELERQLDVQKSKLRLAEEQAEQQVETEKGLRTLLDETNKELAKTKRILQRQKARHVKPQDQKYVEPDVNNSSNVTLATANDTANVSTDLADTTTELLNSSDVPLVIENDTALTSRLDPVDTTTDQIPKPRKSRFVKRIHKLRTTLGYLRKSRANITKTTTSSVQVTMNGQPVKMVIDKDSLESIISLDQWRQLGEPQLKPLTKHDRITSIRTGKYKQRVAWEELGGFFYAMVKLQNKIIIVPIYVCTVEKPIPNFFGRRLFYDLRLHKKNAFLIQTTPSNDTEPSPQTEQVDSVPEMANTNESTTDDDHAIDNTTDSSAEDESATASSTVYESSPDSTWECNVARVVTSIEEVMERKRNKREKYETRISEAVEKEKQVREKETAELENASSANKFE